MRLLGSGSSQCFCATSSPPSRYSRPRREEAMPLVQNVERTSAAAGSSARPAPGLVPSQQASGAAPPAVDTPYAQDASKDQADSTAALRKFCADRSEPGYLRGLAQDPSAG